MNKVYTLLSLVLLGINANAQSTKQLLNFEFEDIELSGVLNLPEDMEPKGIVIIVHGDGKTDAVAGEWHYDVRHSMIKAGYGTYMWDKMGCGNSGGTYQEGQPVQNAALEVVAAIRNLRNKPVKGSDNIGLWGISRAGWINPLVIDQYRDIDFWISVSGVDDIETFKYLLEQNFRIEGHPQDSVDLLVSEWHDGLLLSRGGASYEYTQLATPNLQKNEFWLRMTNGGVNRESYYDYQKILQESPLDEVSDLPLYVKDFEAMLSSLDIPVLALFGETDMTVNWQEAKKLYEKALAPNTDLTIRTFPNCNHNMWRCETGGIFEMQDDQLDYVRCEGFLDTMTDWLIERN